MTNDRVATVSPVEEQDADPTTRATYADIKDTKGIDFVPNFWRVLATNAQLLQMVWTGVKSLMHPEAAGRQSRLNAQTRETIALAVSATNSCSYCVNSHTAALRKLGVDKETIGEIMAIVGLFNQTNSLANGFEIVPDVIPPID